MHKLGIDSETAREIEPEMAQWGSLVKTNAILADIYDMMATINSNLCAIGTGKKTSRPPKYPRPKDRKKEKIGKDALPPEELKAWLERKRKEKEG